jgi:RimJ/RimL family protein N-acetyltransferase
MDPVEINAGGWYLRPLRADGRIDDRPAVVASCLDPEILRWRRRPEPTLAAATSYVARRTAGWECGEHLSWAVCEPTTGEMRGEVELAAVDLTQGVADLACWALPAARGRSMTTTAVAAVLRFGFGGLGLHRVSYAWAEGNEGSARVAVRCGFRLEGSQRQAWLVDGRRTDVILAGRRATDPDPADR